METKKYLIISLVGMLFFLGACGSSSTSSGSTSSSQFIGGEEAMSFSFQDQFPPETIRDSSLQMFNIQFEIENIGEYDIPENSAFVRLKGIDKAAFGLENDALGLPELRGVQLISGNEIPGSKHVAMFTNLQYKETVVSGSISNTFHANLCYPYGTKSSSSLCVSGNAYGTEEENDICDISQESVEVSNSASPVKIENLRQYPGGPSSVQFMFDIVHTPTAQDSVLLRTDSFDARCEVETLFSDKNYVSFKVNSGLAGLDCQNTGSNSGEISLGDTGVATVTCIQDTRGQDNYVKPISIELEFGYLEKISKTVEIKHN